MAINITLPSGEVKKVEKGSSTADLASQLGLRDALAAKVDGLLQDLSASLEEDAKVEFVMFSSVEGKELFWHSGAHLLAQAVLRHFPEAKLTIGPPVEDGFYYDIDHEPFTDEDLKKIEKEMKKIAKERLLSERIELTKAQAKDMFKENPYKRELIEEFEDNLSAYKQGEFVDLCRGPHVPNTKVFKAIKVMKVAGAYWRGDQNNKQLQRIYAIAFPDKKLLKEHLTMLLEAEKRDHRKLGKRLDLYEVDEEIGPGLIFWLPKGNIIKEQLEDWAKETEKAWGYQRVTTPLITKESVFHTSEHLPHYKDSMFSPMDIDGQKYYLKPMNCPFHHKIFASRPRSYKDLPLRLAEYGWCHRYEQSGAIMGLMRVRGMQMNDAHIYCSKEQAVDEFVAVIKLHEYYYKMLGIEDYWMELALRDPASDKYHGNDTMWEDAEALMKEAMEKSGVKYIVEEGGAAFYGPKIDFQIKSVTGRTFTASTNQIDLFMPDKFRLKYVGEDGNEHTPVVIHRAPLGTHERFIGFLIEHFAGRFPLWLSPVQVRVITVAERFESYAIELVTFLEEAGVRAEVDVRSESVGKKVREAQLQLIPLLLTVGEKEVENETIALRTLDGQVKFGLEWKHFRSTVKSAIDEKSLGVKFD